MENYHILLVRDIAPSNKYPYARVRIKSELQRESIFIPYTNEPSEVANPRLEAIKFLESKGLKIIGYGELKDDYMIIVDAAENRTFTRLKSL